MLTGRRLFKAGSDAATLERVKTAEVPAPSQVNPRVPEALDRIVMRALHRDPDQRFESAWQLGQALQDYLFPQTLGQVRSDLARTMQTAFGEEILEERQRLQAGSDAAARMREFAPEGAWDEHTNSSMAPPSVDVAQWGPLVLAGTALLVVPFLIAAVAGLMWVTQQPPQEPERQIQQVTATLDIVVLPAARITIDGRDHGEHDTFSLSDLAPGSHAIRLEADGYEATLETVQLEAGQRRVWTHTLTPLPAPEPAPAPVVTRSPRPRPAAEPTPEPEPVGTGTLSIALVGGGWAWVWVDDKKLERTAPLSGLELKAGRHHVRVENADLGISHSETITISPGERSTVRARPL
jgi:hypothetical protein